MADEWLRDDRWADSKEVEYSSREQWEYVNGVASTKQGCTPGVRDANNAGRTVDDFVALANDKIRSRRPQASLDELLTRDEVVAVRLYTGRARSLALGAAA
jgi:hypothetical protein